MFSQVQDGVRFRQSWCRDTPEQWDTDFGDGSFGKDEVHPGGSAWCVQAAASHQGGGLAEPRVLC